jgi:hypothetical protein
MALNPFLGWASTESPSPSSSTWVPLALARLAEREGRPKEPDPEVDRVTGN